LVAAGCEVTALEIDPAWVKVLRADIGGDAKVLQADFLNTDPRVYSEFDVVVMNPPMNDGVCGLHIAQALRFAPCVVSLIRSADLHGLERYRVLWSRCELARLAFLSGRPAFGGEWNTGATDFCVVHVQRVGTYHGPQRVDFWPDDWR
jgi:hypothetical protein